MKPTPEPHVPRATRQFAPIAPSIFPALEQLRKHANRDGVMLIDRVYAEALIIYKACLELSDLSGMEPPFTIPVATRPKSPAPKSTDDDLL